MTIKCLNHQRSHKFICYQCNCLMCSKCVSIHSKDHPDHFDQWEHIDDIKHSLSTLKLDDIIDTPTTTTTNNNDGTKNNSNNSNHISQINNKLKYLWESLRSSTTLYQALSTTENEIKQHFEQLHQYLIIEEHKLQRDIVNYKHTITDQIDNNVMNLKYLVNIINIFNKLNSNNDINNDTNSSSDEQPTIEDTKTLYSTTTIMESITTSYEFDYNHSSIIIIKHCSMNILVNNDNKQSYIFTTNKPNGVTLINTSNNYSIEELQFDYQFVNTAPSIVSIGEYIYIFGGSGNENKWIQISAKSKSIEHIGDIEGIKGDCYVSVCYDGQDHIYLVNGANTKNRIDRFNIKTMKFESYHQLPDRYDMQVSSMIFKGSLYSVSYHQNLIFQFDLTNKTITDHRIDIKPLSGCHDNNGNFFILDRKNHRFIKYNVETKQTINLDINPHKNGSTFVMYHRESPTSSYIYSFGTFNQCNFRYSIESNQCVPFLRDIVNKDRACCASTSISF
ncbi:hypothetical protein PPL_05019 [Heterostelium album PN500]|uniref:B box-type domain-containing protein n=1 Tax=Heterostelium pallidum (strain ATCC 26659 / Pp 5 / PN500) TaxID=670386 RepID=D3B975_HETP5|nr:hypothetical protein PPL_05019 [Heterostelium album PN500]EFA82114.1 hypothetical protein PPL_05019 [Heterostelium album PN500]|eukprot:XP_020434231.1 hypothetical protein PPL_05019 [Heterostelium album PN500]